MKKIILLVLLMLGLSGISYAADIGNINKAQVDGNNAIYFNGGALSYLTDSETVYPHGASSYYDETGTSGALVKNSSATLLRVIVGTAGTASTLNIWDRGADTTCTSGTEKLTLDTTSISNIYLGIAMTNGICVISTTGTPAKITIVYE